MVPGEAAFEDANEQIKENSRDVFGAPRDDVSFFLAFFDQTFEGPADVIKGHGLFADAASVGDAFEVEQYFRGVEILLRANYTCIRESRKHWRTR